MLSSCFICRAQCSGLLGARAKALLEVAKAWPLLAVSMHVQQKRMFGCLLTFMRNYMLKGPLECGALIMR